MASILLSGPAAEPISLAQAKDFLRVEHDDDDAVIGALIAGARIHIETATRRALLTQDWRLVRDRWPREGRVPVLPVPLQQAIAARVHNADGTTTTLNLGGVAADLTRAPAILDFTWSAMPAPGRATAGIEIDIRVGYGAASDVPEPLRQAIRLLVAHWYENRALAALDRPVSPLPLTIDALIAPYRVLGL